MRKTKYPKALLEVWQWKDAVYKKTKHLSDKIKFFEEDTKEVIERLGLKRTAHLRKNCSRIVRKSAQERPAC